MKQQPTLGIHPGFLGVGDSNSSARTIPLSRGLVALIDPEDFELVSRYSWFAVPRSGLAGRFAAGAKQRNGKMIYMHRLILGALPGEDVDHVDSDQTLDNRRANLRRCTHAQNMARYRSRKPSQSGFRGVVKGHGGSGFMATISRTGRKIYLGTFPDPHNAALAYDLKAIELWGEFARLNFRLEAVQPQPSAA